MCNETKETHRDIRFKREKEGVNNLIISITIELRNPPNQERKKLRVEEITANNLVAASPKQSDLAVSVLGKTQRPLKREECE